MDAKSPIELTESDIECIAHVETIRDFLSNVVYWLENEPDRLFARDEAIRRLWAMQKRINQTITLLESASKGGINR